MPFLESAAQEVTHLPDNEPLRVVLNYLLKHARGRANAKPWENIAAELAKHGIEMTQTKFQQSILKETREGEIFIGSNDHGVGKGYFLIQDLQDALFAREFYARRIAAQKRNLDHLDKLMHEQHWLSE